MTTRSLTTTLAAPSPYPTGLGQVSRADIPAGAQFFRMYNNPKGDKQPLGARHGSSRFSDPGGCLHSSRWATIYLASTLETAFAETVVGRIRIGTSEVVLDRGALKTWRVTRITAQEALRVLDLRDGNLLRAGLHPDITGAEAHKPGQTLAGLAFENESLDGILYQSFLTHEPCLAVFDRSRDKLDATPHEPITEPPWKEATRVLAKVYGIVYAPGDPLSRDDDAAAENDQRPGAGA